jgi:hypothetical protein
MTRPHEERRHHTPTDHRGGGPAIAFAPGSWCAIAVAHVAAERATAGVAAYETLIERARVSAPKAREATVLESHNRRRVIALLHLDGHEGFKHLQAAWDDHHLFSERRAVAESLSLVLYQVAATIAEAAIDPASTDAYAFERVLLNVERRKGLAGSIVAAPGFRGATMFDGDDDGASTVVYRFKHIEEIEAFHASPAAQRVFGPSPPGETFFQVHPVRTFAAD